MFLARLLKIIQFYHFISFKRFPFLVEEFDQETLFLMPNRKPEQ